MASQTRRHFLKSMGAATASMGSISMLSGIASQGCRSNTGSKPNVILVMTDDQGYGDIGAHGSPYVKTPTLDALHAESVRLTDFHVDPCCAPTRASLLTGMYSSRTGVWHTIGGRSLLQKDKKTMADLFQASGYRTAIFGKWHLGDNYPFRPQDRGFQETVIHGGGVVGSNPGFWGNDYYDDTYLCNGEPTKYEGYCNTVWFNEAIRFIGENRQQPFFCFLSTNIPHAPLLVDDGYSEPYRSQVSEQLANYYGMLTKFDEDLAVLLKKIRDFELEDNTILIFLTDNGPCPWYGGIKIDEDGFVEEGYSAGMRGGKIWGYENAHRVPCFIRWPAAGIGGGRDISALTAHFDLLPTLADLCGLSTPGELDLDGVSLKPLLENDSTTWPDRTLFVHNQRVDFPLKYKDYQVLTERWRLVKRGTDELYDIQKDPGQRHDVASGNPQVVRTLKTEYETWWDHISGDFDKYNEIIIGSANENPATLYSHDAHRSKTERVWVIDVEQDGEYLFKTARWPAESKKRIIETGKSDQTLDIGNANLKIGNISESCSVTADMRNSEFKVHLRAGATCLSAWFSDSSRENVYHAGFIYLERVGAADRDKLGQYSPTDPDALLKK